MSQKADKEGNPCQLMFADPEDFGKFPLQDIHLYTVFNGSDHLLGAENRIPLFRHGIDEIFNKLMEATSLASSLQLCTDNKTVQLTLSQAVDVIKSVGHNLNKMFIPIEYKDDVEIPATKKREHPKNQDKQGPKSPPSLHFTVPVENYSAMMISWCIINNRSTLLQITGTVKSVM